jgi:hypothetical protein
VIGKPAPFGSALVDAVDAAMRTHQPQHALSGTQRTWLALCITAVLVTNSMCWARFARASLGTYAMAALSWMFRPSKSPWAHLLVASVRVILQHHGIPAGLLVVDDIHFSTLPQETDMIKIPRALFERFIDAVCYAA